MFTNKVEKKFTLLHFKKPISAWKFVLRLGLGLLILLPIALILLIVQEFGVNVPAGDEWGLASLVIKLHTGGFTWSDFWTPHNEHRILFLRVLLLALAKLGGWDIRKELYANLFLALISLITIWRLARLSLETRAPFRLGFLVFSSLLLFSTMQWETWTTGYGFVWFLNNYCVLAAILALTCWQGQWRGWLAVVAACVIATYSVGAGILLWPVIVLGLLIQKRAWGWRPIILWVGVGLAVIGFYFYDYHPAQTTNSQQHLSYALQHPQEIIFFILSFIGAPIFRAWGGTLPSAFGGFFGLALVGFTIYLAWRQSVKSWLQAGVKLLPWLLLMLFTVLNAALSSVNRTDLGLEAATASRYTTLGALFWIGLAAALLNVVPELYRSSSLVIRASVVVTTSLLSLLLLSGYLVNYRQDYGVMVQNSALYENSRLFLYHYDTVPPETLIPLLPIPGGPQAIKGYAWALQQYKEGPFQTSEADYRQTIEKHWQNWLTDAPHQQYAYSLDKFQLLNPPRQLVHPNSNTLEFDTANSSKMSFYIHDTKLAEFRRPILLGGEKSQMMDIQSKNAYFIFIDWESNRKQVLPPMWAYGLPDGTGWTHFRIVVPKDIQGFSLDLHYAQEKPRDNLKIDIYNRE